MYFYYCFNFKVIVSHNPNWVACFISLYYALLSGNVVQGETLIKYYLPTYLPTYNTLNSKGDKTPSWRALLVTRKPVDNDDPHLTNITDVCNSNK